MSENGGDGKVESGWITFVAGETVEAREKLAPDYDSSSTTPHVVTETQFETQTFEG